MMFNTILLFFTILITFKLVAGEYANAGNVPAISTIFDQKTHDASSNEFR